MSHELRPKLRVALFSGNYNYVMDGPVRALNALVAHLERHGHEVLVFAPTAKKSAFDHAGTLVSIPSAAFPGKRSEYRFGFGLIGGARKKLAAFAPDIIHVAAPDFAGWQALRYGERNHIPVVASFHTRFDTYPRYYNMAWAEKYLTAYMRNFYGRCAQIYAPSTSMREALCADRIGNDIRIWTRGVDNTLFHPGKRDLAWRHSLGIGENEVVVAFAGRLVLEKGIDLFAKAFTKAKGRTSSLRALVIGDGPERSYFEKLLPGEVFLGHQQGTALARAYASADIFFNPSTTETFGNVTLEAMASGLPVIGAAATGSQSLIDDGITGFITEPNAQRFAEKIQILAASGPTRQTLGHSALEKAQRFTWESVLDDLIGYYTEVTQQVVNPA